jgi:Fe2+ or Zn2+ uptake regulation protein
MTTRELYNATINALRGYNTDEANELIAEFEAAIAKMDSQATARRAKQAEKAAEKQAEKAPLRDALLEVIGDTENPKTASMLIEEAGLTETVKPASVPSLLRPLVESGLVLKVDMKVPGKGTQRGYIRA